MSNSSSNIKLLMHLQPSFLCRFSRKHVALLKLIPSVCVMSKVISKWIATHPTHPPGRVPQKAAACLMSCNKNIQKTKEADQAAPIVHRAWSVGKSCRNSNVNGEVTTVPSTRHFFWLKFCWVWGIQKKGFYRVCLAWTKSSSQAIVLCILRLTCKGQTKPLRSGASQTG